MIIKWVGLGLSHLVEYPYLDTIRTWHANLNWHPYSRLQAARSCSRARHARSWSVTPAGAIQDKIGQRAIQLPRGWNSRLSQAARPSRELALFWKTWLFTFHYHPSINTSFTHKRKRASRENFERKTLEKDKIDSQSSLRDSSNSSTLFFSIVKSLRGLLPKPFLTISISVRGLFGALGSS